MSDKLYGNGKKYAVMPGIDFYTQEYDAPQGLCAVPGEVPVLEISWCRRGRMECRMRDGCILYMGEGDIFLSMTDNHAEHLEFPLGYYSGIAVSVAPDSAVLPAAFASRGISPSELIGKFFADDDCFLFRASPETKHFFEPVFTSSEDLLPLHIRLRVMELLLFLHELDPKAQSPMTFYHKRQTDIIKDVERDLRHNLSQRRTIDELSAKYCISATSLKTSFRDVFGSPIAAYMKRLRMERAAELLLTGDASVAEIGQSVGYETPSKFTSTFKTYFGMTPAEYRRCRSDAVSHE